jgi:type I restriction enzyme M protein
LVLGLIFLKYISDAFEEHRQEGDDGETPQAAERCREKKVFWVPPASRWSHLQEHADTNKIGAALRSAIQALEKDNPSLRDILPKEFSSTSLDQQRLGELVRLIGQTGLAGKANRSRDLLGRVYEYFLGSFAEAEGKKGGQFYTPQCVVEVLVEMLAPYKGTVFDPCCGSGGIFVQSEKFVEAHGGQPGDVRIFGQESNRTTWRLAKLNLALRGIDGSIAWNETGSFHRDAHPELKADYVLSNPPFNDSDWGQGHLRKDRRWVYGLPPAGNANFAWVQHFIHHLAPDGFAGFVLANGSMSSSQAGEGEIRRAIIEADLLDCMLALPGQLFYSTQIPACVWILAKNKASDRFRNRQSETLFIDAREMGIFVDRAHAQLSKEAIERIASTYRAWRGDAGAPSYQDVPGFAKAANLAEIRRHKHVLVPGRYVGFASRPDSSFDVAQIQPELEELLARFAQAQQASQSALSTLRELFHG